MGLRKEINPISEEIKDISNDELRGRIERIRGEVRGNAQKYKDQMAEIRTEIETLDYDKREPLWKKIDDLREEMFDNYARDLDRVLPEVSCFISSRLKMSFSNEFLSHLMLMPLHGFFLIRPSSKAAVTTFLNRP